MKTLRLILFLSVVLAITACEKQGGNSDLRPVPGGINDHYNFNPGELKIAVLSDLHYMDPSLLRADGSAFQMYLMQDRKLLAESDAILRQLISELLIEKPDLVLISGDLTKDGELVCHQEVIKQLRILEANRIKVLVVPGNHDINNPDAVLFDGDNTEPVPTISAEEFSSLYAEYGYGSAIARDPNSLSYISEPFKDFFVVAIDANEYYDNTSEYSVTAGKIKDVTMDWIEAQLAGLKTKKGKTVIGMMHHGVIEHFMGESVIFPDYLVDDRFIRADELMQAGLKVIFTGHFHGNDAVQLLSDGLSLTDIETGSPVSYNSPYRIINLIDNKMYVTTKHITTIDYPGLDGIPFPEYEAAISFTSFEFLAKYMLMSPPYDVPEMYAAMVAPIFAKAMMAHFAGDETISDETYAEILFVQSISPDLANILFGFYTDLPPSDNNLVIDLN
ncbi:MAG: metallophosphoesterase [Bacteroidales bacterium]